MHANHLYNKQLTRFKIYISPIFDELITSEVGGITRVWIYTSWEQERVCRQLGAM